MKNLLSKLDPLHWALFLLFLVVSACAWIAIEQRNAALRETQRTIDYYLNTVNHL